MSARVLAVVLAAGCWASAASAQRMRPFSTFRQLHGQTSLHTRLEYAAGTFRLLPGSPGTLYRMTLAYDDERFVPLSRFDAADGSVTLGLRAAGGAGLRVVNEDQLQQTAVIEFSPRVELALDLQLGAVEADLELGGLRVGAFDLRAGASQAVVRFSRPNGARCRSARVSAGAAELTLLGLGNSRCDTIDFEGGVGKVVLDFSGAWPASSHVSVRMAMGDVTLRLPRQVGVRLTMDKFLASFDPAGLVRRGASYESANYATAERRLEIDLTTALGGVQVEWIE